MKKIIFVFLLTFSSLFAMKESEIKDSMSLKIDNVMKILEKKDLNNNEKGIEIIKILDEIFDYELMAKIALGKDTWNSITSQEQDDFTKTFEQKLKKSYIEKLELYNDQKVKIIDLVPYKKTRLQLQTQIVGKNEVFDINYNFYNKEKDGDNWLIYDVDLLGVSIIQTYRQQFSGILEKISFREMLLELKNSLVKTEK